MKKILLLFIFGVGISFSDCNYTNNQDFFIKSFIQSVKEEKLEEKIYCDKKNVKMLYYKEYDVEIGFIYSADLNNISEYDLLELIAEFSEDNLKLLNRFSKKTKNIRVSEDELPNFLNIRMYIKQPDESIFMISKVTTNISTGDATYWISKELKQKHREYIKNILNFDYYFTDDIIY